MRSNYLGCALDSRPDIKPLKIKAYNLNRPLLLDGQLVEHGCEDVDLLLSSDRDHPELLVRILLANGHQLGVVRGVAGLLDHDEKFLGDFSDLEPLVHGVVGQRRSPVLHQRLLLVVEELQGNVQLKLDFFLSKADHSDHVRSRTTELIINVPKFDNSVKKQSVCSWRVVRQ